MNASELVEKTIETIERDGWEQGRLYQAANGGHCVLGAIGRARWGQQWDLECEASFNQAALYRRLYNDPVTREVVSKLHEAVLARDESLRHRVEDYCDRPPSSEFDEVYMWNDEQESSEAIVELLEKVQAEIGITDEEKDEA